MDVAPRHYEKVQDRMSRDEFDAKVREKIREWGGLLDTDAAALLVLEGLGIDVAEWTPIVKIEENAEVSVRGEVVAITPTRTFARQDGSSGRVVNVTLMDASGTCRLVLWDDDVDLVEKGQIRVGAFVRCLDCFVRGTNFGLEVSSGKFGAIVPE